LAEYLKKPLKYKNLEGVRVEMIKAAPHFANLNSIIESPFVINKREFNCNTEVIEYNDNNYYLTDPICRASVTMSKAAAAFTKDTNLCKH